MYLYIKHLLGIDWTCDFLSKIFSTFQFQLVFDLSSPKHFLRSFHASICWDSAPKLDGLSFFASFSGKMAISILMSSFGRKKRNKHAYSKVSVPEKFCETSFHSWSCVSVSIDWDMGELYCHIQQWASLFFALWSRKSVALLVHSCAVYLVFWWGTR